jgi:hypothetical protein
MNQIHRLGLGVAVVAAVLTVAGALVVDGYVTAGKDIAQATTTQQAPTSVPTIEPTASPTPSVDPLTVYVKPAPNPPVTRVAEPAPVVPLVHVPNVTAPPTPDVTPPTIRVIVPSPTGENDNGGTDN